MIDDPLDKNSSIDAVMKEGNVWEELEIDVDFVDLDKIKAIIKRDNCCDLKSKYKELMSMAVRKFENIIHLHDDYSFTFTSI